MCCKTTRCRDLKESPFMYIAQLVKVTESPACLFHKPKNIWHQTWSSSLSFSVHLRQNVVSDLWRTMMSVDSRTLSQTCIMFPTAVSDGLSCRDSLAILLSINVTTRHGRQKWTTRILVHSKSIIVFFPYFDIYCYFAYNGIFTTIFTAILSDWNVIGWRRSSKGKC